MWLFKIGIGIIYVDYFRILQLNYYSLLYSPYYYLHIILYIFCIVQSNIIIHYMSNI